MLAFLIWGAIACALFYFVAIRPMSYWKRRGVFQLDSAWLFGENFKSVFKQECFIDVANRVYAKTKHLRYGGWYQFTTPAIVINDAELIKQITVKDFEHFTDHPTFIENEDDLFAKNLFSLRGPKWKDMRPILSPSFTGSKMKTMFLLVRDCVENFSDHFVKNAKEGEKVNLKHAFTRLTNDVIATTAFGIQVDSVARPQNDFYNMGKKLTNLNGLLTNIKFVLILCAPKIVKWFKFSILDGKVQKYFYSIIADTIKTREEQKIVRPDMIHLMMEARKGNLKNDEREVIETGFATVQEMIGTSNNNKKHTINGENLTTKDMVAQALIFFFAGFDTVSTAMTLLAYELAINTEVQDKLRDEIKETHEACKGQLTYDALMKMKYMDMVISEGLRKWPPTAGINRECTKPYTIQPTLPGEKPVHVEKGVMMFVSSQGIHHDPKYYPEPEKFIPERFSEENRDKIDPYLYLPFGLGPRNCIGSRFALMELKALFYYLLLKLEIVPTKDTPIPPKFEPGFQINLVGGGMIGFRKVRN